MLDHYGYPHPFSAHVGQRIFYVWKPRFLVGGYAALDQFASRAPRRTRRSASEVEQRVIALRQSHPT